MSALRNFWKLLKLLLGFPPEPTEAQKNEEIPTMRQSRDCAVPAVALACGVKYEQAYKALWHWDLPLFLESPLLSNPLNLKRAIKALGKTYRDDLNWVGIDNGQYEPMRLILLVKLDTNLITAILFQHWVVVGKKNADNTFDVYWGDKQEPRKIKREDLYKMYHTGVLKDAIEVKL
jgi:hypothetical protein